MGMSVKVNNNSDTLPWSCQQLSRSQVTKIASRRLKGKTLPKRGGRLQEGVTIVRFDCSKITFFCTCSIKD